MSEASQTWTRPTFEDSSSAISSPALECGATPSDSPDGPMTDLFGREVVLAPVSAPQEKARGLETLVTSGHIGHPSSGSAALQLSLESRLHQRLDTAGSTLFTLTWKRRRTPLGRSYLERQASVRRTNAKDCTSVPILASVPTPMSGSPATETYNAAGNSDYSRKIVELASTATPAARDYRSESATDEYNETRWNHKRGKALSAQVTLSETGVDPDGSIRTRLDQLPRQAQLADSGADCDWWHARDEKYRPIEPGLFPLATWGCQSSSQTARIRRCDRSGSCGGIHPRRRLSRASQSL